MTAHPTTSGPRSRRDTHGFMSIAWTVLAACLATSAATPPAAHAQAESEPNPAFSTLYLETVSRAPQFTEPWRRGAPEDGSGTGFVVNTPFDGKTAHFILTANHVVQHADTITAYLPGDLGQHAAEVVAASPEFDLALLRLKRGDHLKQIEPLPISPVLPSVQQPIRVFGYPIGGVDQSVTSGIVSRVEAHWTGYDRIGLRAQIDAALNPGNSGGPAVGNGKVVGLAYQVNEDAENIGYLVPSNEINRFFRDIEDGTYDRPAHLSVAWQSLVHDAERQALKLPAGETGVWVRDVRSLRSGHPYDSKLRPNDVITAIGNADISNEGQVNLPSGISVRFEYLANRFALNGTVPLTVYRNGRRLTIEEPAPNVPPRLVPWLKNQPPPYYIFGPIVFTTASRELYYQINEGFRPVLGLYGSPLMTRFLDWQDHDGHELVAVASSYFPHATTRGLEDPIFNIVQTINGRPVRNLAQLVRTLEASDDRFLEIVFADRWSNRAIFDRAEIQDATEQILDDNGIRHRASAELRPLLRN